MIKQYPKSQYVCSYHNNDIVYIVYSPTIITQGLSCLWIGEAVIVSPPLTLTWPLFRRPHDPWYFMCIWIGAAFEVYYIVHTGELLTQHLHCGMRVAIDIDRDLDIDKLFQQCWLWYTTLLLTRCNIGPTVCALCCIIKSCLCYLMKSRHDFFIILLVLHFIIIEAVNKF